MECVFRMTYKELYFFKKTLKETGQLTLAEYVVVRLQDGSKLEVENVWHSSNQKFYKKPVKEYMN